jgi:DMSO/TMAO reductase YedYZ molybdopterin-dependent catalytic subunit
MVRRFAEAAAMITRASRVSRLPRPEEMSRFWRSPIRGPWLTSVFGVVLLVGIPIEFVTGVVSWAAYDPRLRGNDVTTHHGILSVFLFDWVTSPSWIYRVSQGTHVLLGLVLVPVLLAKLWSVIPRLFAWPPLRSVAHLLERASLLLLVSGAVFEFVTGIMNIDYDYSFGFSFYDGHFFGAWVFIAGFVVHATLRFPRMSRALRSRPFNRELRTGLSRTTPEEPEPGDDPSDSLIAADPAAPTISRRGVLGLVGGSSLAVFLMTAGQSIRSLQSISVLSPRTQSYGTGPNDFQVNRTAVAAGIRRDDIGDSWALRLIAESSGRSASLTRDQLLEMQLVTADLPIACVEGWSVQERWTGVPLRRLAHQVGISHPTGARIESLERNGAFASASLSGHQVRATSSLLALKVNGADLSLDHGYPARTIIPAAPGVHNTKWVSRITFSGVAT